MNSIPVGRSFLGFLKWFFLVCAVVLAVLIVVVASVYWYVNPARLKAIVQPRLASVLGREVTFDRIDWGLSDGVVISGLRVQDRIGTDPTDVPHVSTSLVAERAQVHVSPRAWLSGDGWLGELVLEGVVATVAKLDHKDVGDSQLKARDEGVKSSADVLLPIDRVRVQDGTLRVENYPSGRRTIASGISGRMRALQSSGTLALDSDLAAAQFTTWTKRDTLALRALQMSGQVTLGGTQMPPFGPIDVSVRAATGAWLGIALHHLEVALHTKNGRLHLEPIRGQVWEGALEGSLVWDNSAWEGAVSLVNVRAERILQSAGRQIPVYGAVDITTHIADGAVANGSVKMAEGRIVKWDVFQRNLRLMERLGLLTADDIPLRDVVVVFQLQDNAVILDGSKFVAADMACTVRGSGTLAGQLNYVFDVAVPASRIKVAGFPVGRALGAFFKSAPTIPVQIKINGTTRAPKVTIKKK